MKRENVEKTAKIEGLNEKISELLHRSQRYKESCFVFSSLHSKNRASCNKPVDIINKRISGGVNC